MRPPICFVCDVRFDPTAEGGGGLVSFARDPADAAWYRRVARTGAKGHPPHQAWFCADHLPAARALGDLTRGAALSRLRAGEA